MIRHLRNAVAHGNRFHIPGPHKLASWPAHTPGEAAAPEYRDTTDELIATSRRGPSPGRRTGGSTTTAPRCGWGRKLAVRPVSAPTLVIWGQGDRYLGPKLAEPHHDDVPNLDRVERLPDASHWVHHDEAERVNELLVDFLGPARGSQNGRTSMA